MQNIYKRLKSEFNVRQNKTHIKVVLPLITWVNGGLLSVKIKPTKLGYEICSATNLFLEANAGGDQTFYFNIFEKYDKNYHFNIKIKNGKIYKDYNKEDNILVALNEFIRFYIILDDFILKNNIIGNESEYPL